MAAAAFALALLVAVGGVGTAAAAQDVTGCTTIDSAGAYNLTSDITNSGADPCIRINASDVVLNGQDHLVDGDGSGSLKVGILISSTATLDVLSNVTVRNLTVTDWSGDGVALEGASSSRITRVNATSNGNGISLENAASDFTQTDNNTLVDNMNGIETFSLDTNTIQDNEFRGNNVGIDTAGSDRSLTIESNTFEPDVSSGILLRGLGHTVADNTIRSPPNHGIDIVRDNPISGAQVVVRNNTIRDSGDSGIRAAGEGGETLEDVLLRANTVTGTSSGDGITVRNGSSVTLRGNHIDKGADVIGTNILDSSDVTIEDDTLNDHQGSEFTNVFINGSDNVVVRNVTIADDESTSRSGAGVVAQHSTSVTVAESQITLDESGDAVQIRNSQSLKVVNNDFTKTGIIIRDSSDGVVRGNTVFGNRSGGNGAIWGVNLDGNSNITVENNRLDNHQDGVLFGYGSSDITVRNNRITNPIDVGIYVARGATGTTISNNTVVVSAGVPILETFNTSRIQVQTLTAGTSSGSNMQLDFTAKNVTVRTVASEPAPPSGQSDIGIYLNATNTGSPNFPDGTNESFLDLTITYPESAASSVDESTLSLWRYDSATDDWTDLDGSNDPAANTVSKNITNYSVFAPLATQSTTSGDSDGGEDTPEITDYSVTADGDTITVSFDSDENLVDIEVDVSGAEDATLTREDFSGDEFQGYEATYTAGANGTYTLELVTAADASSNDGAEGETFSQTVTVGPETGPTETPTPTPTEDGGTATATEDGGTATATEDGGTATATEDGGTATTDDETSTQEDGPGFGPILAVVALLAGAVLVVRRR